MRKGIFYMAMILCTSLSILITSCPAYAESRSEQVETGEAYSVTFIDEGQLCRINGFIQLVPVGGSDSNVVQEVYTELEEQIAGLPESPKVVFEKDDMAEFYQKMDAKQIQPQIDDWAKQRLNENRENNEWEDAVLCFDDWEISK